MLPERDAAALLSFAGELVGLDDPVAFPPELLRRLGQLVSCANVTYSVLDRDANRTLFLSWCSENEGGIWLDTAPDNEAYFRLKDQHPLCHYRETSGDWTSAHRISEFATLREFQSTELWDELYRGEDVNYWLDIGLAAQGAKTSVFIFTRSTSDFDERDQLALDLLQPCLERRAASVAFAAECAEALAHLEDADSEEAHRVVLCSASGVVEFASARSRALLTRYFAPTSDRVPSALLRAFHRGDMRAVAECNGSRLIVRATRVGDLLLLLLGESDTRVDRLTVRQTEILRHVARGETDAEIALDLGIAPATVNKHLEQVYDRLGVHTRTAAAALLA